MKSKILFILFLIHVPMSQAGDTWSGWRGPTGLGISDEKDLPLEWGGPKNVNVKWKVPLPGMESKASQDHNQSSPIVWKDRVVLISTFWPENVARDQYPEHHVACYSTDKGKLLWDVKVEPGPWKLKDLRGGYSAPTPCTDGRRIYVLFGSSELLALNFEGKVQWRTPITPFAWDVAIGTSPVLTEDAVLVLADGTKPALSRLIAFDRETGKVKWEQKRPKANFSHSTPVLVTVKGKPQLLIASSGAVEGVDPANGKTLWWAKNRGDATTPAFGGGLVYSDNGRGGSGIAVDPTGEGDVSETKVKWKTRPIPTGFASPIIVDGLLYRIHKPGVLSCFDIKTGERVYSERLPNGVSTSASPIVTPDGRLYLASAGKSVVLATGPKFKILSTNNLNDGGQASPAVANGCLFLRGKKYLYCIGRSGG